MAKIASNLQFPLGKHEAHRALGSPGTVRDDGESQPNLAPGEVCEGSGAVTQFVGPPGSRKTDAALATLLAAAEDRLPCAWVEARAGLFMPSRSAPAGWAWYCAGLFPAFLLASASRGAPFFTTEAGLSRIAPARGLPRAHASASGEVRRRCIAALHATEQLLTQRRWAVVALQLSGVPPSTFREIPQQTFDKLGSAASGSGASLLVVTDQRPLQFGGPLNGFGTIVRFEPRRLPPNHLLLRWKGRSEILGAAALVQRGRSRGKQPVVSAPASGPSAARLFLLPSSRQPAPARSNWTRS